MTGPPESSPSSAPTPYSRFASLPARPTTALITAYQVAARVEVAASEDGVSFSAWLSAAAEQHLLLRAGIRGVQDWEAEAGALTAAEVAADEALLSRLLGETGS